MRSYTRTGAKQTNNHTYSYISHMCIYICVCNIRMHIAPHNFYSNYYCSIRRDNKLLINYGNRTRTEKIDDIKSSNKARLETLQCSLQCMYTTKQRPTHQAVDMFAKYHSDAGTGMFSSKYTEVLYIYRCTDVTSGTQFRQP